MSKRRTWVAAAIALCACFATWSILASNMGFKITYPLYKAGSNGSKSGTQDLGLPYVLHDGLTDAFSLIQDVEGGGPPFSKVVSVSKFLTAGDSLQTYTGRMGSPGSNFVLAPGECYRIQMSADVNYVIAGFHDPTLAVPLRAPGAGSRSGTNAYVPPYNMTAVSGFDLMKDIEGGGPGGFSKVIAVSKFILQSDSLQSYNGRMGSPGSNFLLSTGDCYRIQMSVPVSGYVASHY